MIEYTALKISRKIHSVVPESNVNIMAYEIGRKINYYSIIILTVIMGLFTDKLPGSILAMTGCAALRYLSGGRHMSLTACTIFSVSLFTISPILPISSGFMVLLTYLTVLVIAIYSKRGARQKLLSLVLVFANLLISSPVLALVFAVQAASLIEKKGGAGE
ncbi:accessory gene regulator B family protein [Paenibacillus sp. BAC0078]